MSIPEAPYGRVNLCDPSNHSHDKATRDARHAVRQVVRFAKPKVDHSLCKKNVVDKDSGIYRNQE